MSLYRLLVFVGSSAAVYFVGCSGEGHLLLGPDGGGVVVVSPRAPGGGPGGDPACAKMDLVFIIDDSGSMEEEQENLAENFPQFVRVLEEYRNPLGDPLDYRLAITTTSTDTVEEGEKPGPNGALLYDESCGMTRRWIERSDPGVSKTFSCAAQVGTDGSAAEMPLRAWDLAFTDRIEDGTNRGFLRDDALLAAVILTDEDDCSHPRGPARLRDDQCRKRSKSLVPVRDLHQQIDLVKGKPSRWAVSVIAGPGPGGCESALGNAEEAYRLRKFVENVGPNANFSSICEGDLAAGLMSALNTFGAACEDFEQVY